MPGETGESAVRLRSPEHDAEDWTFSCSVVESHARSRLSLRERIVWLAERVIELKWGLLFAERKATF